MTGQEGYQQPGSPWKRRVRKRVEHGAPSSASRPGHSRVSAPQGRLGKGNGVGDASGLPRPAWGYLVQRCQPVHVGRVDAGGPGQQALDLLGVPAGAGGQEDGAVLEANAGPAAVPAPDGRHRLQLRQGALPALQLLRPPQPRRLGPLHPQMPWLRHADGGRLRLSPLKAGTASDASTLRSAQRRRRHLYYSSGLPPPLGSCGAGAEGSLKHHGDGSSEAAVGRIPGRLCFFLCPVWSTP